MGDVTGSFRHGDEPVVASIENPVGEKVDAAAFRYVDQLPGRDQRGGRFRPITATGVNSLDAD
ncbi:hypothetical protein [Rhizobium leguminosarum]|uniref:hypothetical protein n=1 Tax=Rhizobium leguminosarum TaxID=384 RepID=UPI00143F779B|nr:hypothetical protein [Rhizobium leguminosarum]